MINQLSKETEPLTNGRMVMFFLFCWGVIPWSIAQNFKKNGYPLKHKQAVRAMYSGLVFYVLGTAIFVLVVAWLNQ